MAEKLGFAVVGVGWFGSKRISALSAIHDASLKWVVDTNKADGMRVARAAKCEYSPDLENAIEDPNVDCVVVCTPNKMHPNIVIDSLKHDKHVLCEKPLARSSAEAALMVNAAQKSKGYLKTGSNHRYFPNVAKAFEIVREGRIGEPIFLRGSIGHDGELLKGRWFWNPDLAGGGTFLDNGCHLLDISREIMGNFVEATGFVDTTFWPVAPLEDNGFALFKTAGRKYAQIQSSWIEWYGYMYFEVYGKDGFVICDSRNGNKLVFGKKGKSEVITFDYSGLPARSHELELRDFIQRIRREEQPSPSGEDGLRVLQMVEALYSSSKLGKRVSF